MSRNAFAQCERDYNEAEERREQAKAERAEVIHRAAACVRACAGIANPDDYEFERVLKLADEQRMACLQYEQVIEKLNEALEYQKSLCKFHGASGIGDLIVQRNELLYVLEAIVANDFEMTLGAKIVIREAIAKATGGQS